MAIKKFESYLTSYLNSRYFNLPILNFCFDDIENIFMKQAIFLLFILHDILMLSH